MPENIDKIVSFITPLLEGTDMFVVSIKIKPINNIKVYLDADNGLSIEKSAKVNRKLYAAIEESELYPNGDFSLEVSSPGVDEPLQSLRQYKKNTGRKVQVTLQDGTEKTGIMQEVQEDHIVVDVKAAKKKENVVLAIPFTDIKQTIVQIIF
jgi:ribosome maturation factor RimP